MVCVFDELGVDIIEIGFLVSLQFDCEVMVMIVCEVCCLILVVLLCCLVVDIEIFVKVLDVVVNVCLYVFLLISLLYCEYKLWMSCEQVLELVYRYVSLVCSYVDDVEFFVEDVMCIEEDFLIEVMCVVVVVGVIIINLFDIVGFIMFEEICGMFQWVIVGVFDSDCIVFSIYCYNDLGLVVVNLLVVIEGGVCQVECIINGIGECVGNCLLEELVMVLKVCNVFYEEDICINILCIVVILQLLQCLVGMLVQCNKVIVGVNVFVYELGIYQYGMLCYCGIYEIMCFEDVGWENLQMVLGCYSGCVVVEVCLCVLGFWLEEEELKLVFEQFKVLCEQQCVVIDVDLQVLMQGSFIQNGYCLVLMIISDVGSCVNVLVELFDLDGNCVVEIVQGDGLVDVLFGVLFLVIGVQLMLDSYYVYSVGIGVDVCGEVNLSVCYDGVEYEGIGISCDIIEVFVLVWLDVVNCLLCQCNVVIEYFVVSVVV